MLIADANLFRHITCSVDILHVMLSEYLHLLLFPVRHNQNSIVAVSSVRMNLVAICRNASIFCYFLSFNIVAVINQAATFFDSFNKDSELFKIAVKCWENVDMIPAYSTNYSDMRMVFVKLRHSVYRRSEVFVTLDYHIFRGFAEAHHHVEAFKLSPNHEISLDSGLFHHVQNHRGDGGLSMAAANHNADFVFTLFVKIFRI